MRAYTLAELAEIIRKSREATPPGESWDERFRTELKRAVAKRAVAESRQKVGKNQFTVRQSEEGYGERFTA